VVAGVVKVAISAAVMVVTQIEAVFAEVGHLRL